MGAIANLLSPYASVRAYIARSMLLKREEIERLASTRSIREMWDVLRNTPMGSYLGDEVPSDESTFRTEMFSFVHTLFSSFARILGKERREYLSLFLLEVEMDILKSLIHRWIDGKRVEDAASVSMSPLFTEETLDKITSAAHPVSFQEALPLPGWMVEGLAELLSEAAKAESHLRIIHVYWQLDSRYYSHLWKEAEKFGGEQASLRRVLGVKIDLTNLERIIRGRVRGVSAEEIRENLIDVFYGISREEMSRAAEAETLELFRSSLESSPYGDLVERSVSLFSERRKLEAVSTVFREFEVDDLKRYLVTDPLPLTPASDFSMAMLAALLRLEMIQIEVLERLFRAKIYKLSKEQTLNLVAFYNL